MEVYRKVMLGDLIDINYPLFNKLYSAKPEEIQSTASWKSVHPGDPFHKDLSESRPHSVA